MMLDPLVAPFPFDPPTLTLTVAEAQNVSQRATKKIISDFDFIVFILRYLFFRRTGYNFQIGKASPTPAALGKMQLQLKKGYRLIYNK
jgi:hypothetical protein